MTSIQDKISCRVRRITRTFTPGYYRFREIYATCKRILPLSVRHTLKIDVVCTPRESAFAGGVFDFTIAMTAGGKITTHETREVDSQADRYYLEVLAKIFYNMAHAMDEAGFEESISPMTLKKSQQLLTNILSQSLMKS